MGISSREATAAPMEKLQQQQRLRQARNARRHSVLATPTTEEDKTNSNIAEESTERQRRRGAMISVKITSSNPRKVPLAWLSGTEATKMAFQARQHAAKSTVRFHDVIASTVGRSVYDLTEVDKDGLWYTKQEIMAITKENNELSRVTTLRQFHMDNHDANDNNNGDEDCLRGLETLVSMRASLTKRFQRNAVRQAVLDEQRRQRIKGILDPDLIRKLSRTHSGESRELALLMGKADSEELQQQENGRYHYSGGVGGGVGGYSNGRRRQHSTASASSTDDVSTKTSSSCSGTSRTSISSFGSSVMLSVNEVSDLMLRRSKKGAGLVISAKKVSEIPPMEMPIKTRQTKERKSNRMTSPVKRRSPAATDDGVGSTMVKKSPSKAKRRSSLDSTIASIASEEANHRLTNTPPAATKSNSMEDRLDMGKLQCRPRVMAQQWLSPELCPINTGPCIVRYHQQDHHPLLSSPQSPPETQETTKLVINHKRREMVLSPIKKKSSSNKTMTSSSPYDGHFQRREIVVD